MKRSQEFPQLKAEENSEKSTFLKRRKASYRPSTTRMYTGVFAPPIGYCLVNALTGQVPPDFAELRLWSERTQLECARRAGRHASVVRLARACPSRFVLAATDPGGLLAGTLMWGKSRRE